MYFCFPFGRQGEREIPFICWIISKCLQQLMLCQNLETNPGLSCGWQGPKYLGHHPVSQDAQQEEAGIKSETQGHELMWDEGTLSGYLNFQHVLPH